MKRTAEIIFNSYGILAFLTAFVFAVGSDLISADQRKKWDLAKSWVISAEQAYQLKQSGAVFLDARDISLRFLPRIADIKSVTWEEFSLSGSPNNGKLLPKKDILSKLEKLGITEKTTVVVIGDPLNGWGEEGRIVWTLRSVGYQNSFWIDGGAKAYSSYLVEIGKGKPPVKQELKSNPGKSSELDIDHNQLKSAWRAGDKNLYIVDVREEREFKGETPYGESRGGHIPGAKWIYFKEFLDDKGYLKSKEEIQIILNQQSISKNGTVVSYCTGGIRSAWTTSVLLSYGISAKNYSGSMWEWSALSASDYPLVK
ncbi:sulfurtransferase [Leptospira ilyithenensis]|uniref:Thiosulfate sulfurtransferase n=1 Tax=Leptospira ilyithenensis TaxID=2484901 RepID=A0A4R9LJT2_9LEPT|nr:rhodanese-like domain-containing protein [Leptospira ilyithenensis]TGN07157.1 thiosulfate sulfurtransferase [Leptospira ilyithenensis]